MQDIIDAAFSKNLFDNISDVIRSAFNRIYTDERDDLESELQRGLTGKEIHNLKLDVLAKFMKDPRRYLTIEQDDSVSNIIFSPVLVSILNETLTQKVV